MARKILVLGAGPSQIGLLRAARERGLFVIACDRDPRAPGFEHADRRALVSSEDERDIARLAEAERVDGIISPGADWPVAIAARVASRLGLQHPLSPQAAALAVSKTPQRERFRERNVPQPRWTTDAEEARAFRFPSVVKSPDRQGQRGLTLVETPDELPAAIAAARAASRGGGCIIEELAPGPEVTVNGFSIGGRFCALTITDRLTADPPAFGVALAHAWPSDWADESAVDAARLAAEALGILDGPTYTQLRLGTEGPMVVELAARLGGGHDAELCQAALGINLNGLALSAALGEDIEPPAPSDAAGGACVRFLVAPEGELLEVRGLDDAVAVEGVLEARSYRRPGWSFGPLRRGADRAGFVLARGESRDEALARAAAAIDRVRFEVAHVEAAV